MAKPTLVSMVFIKVVFVAKPLFNLILINSSKTIFISISITIGNHSR
nr:MAG TPA: hypothetical protein [Caudoviricetes sp.]